MKKIFFIFPEFKNTITGGTLYDLETIRYLKKIHVPIKKIIVPSSINRMKLSCLINNLPKKSIILIDGYLANKIYFLFRNNIHILMHHPSCLENSKGKMSNLNLYFSEKKALSYSKSIITVSNYMKKVISSILNRVVKTEVAYPGIDKQYYINERNAEAQNILAIGNVIERKGYSVLLDSLVLVKSNWHLNIVGNFSPEDPYYLKLIDKVTKYDLSRKIKFLGNISNDEKMRCMLQSKIFALPTFYEGFGISLVEASALGLDVITTDLPVLREVLRGGHIQFVPMNNAKRLAEAIETSLSRKFKSNHSRLKHYDWLTTAKTFKRVLYAN